MYALQIRDHDRKCWVTTAKGTLFLSDVQAYLWLCHTPSETRPDTSWGWRLREATKAELAKPHKIPMLPSKGSLAAARSVMENAQ